MLRYPLVAVPLGLAVLAQRAQAAEYYVAPTGGNDSGACSLAAPCATVEGGQAKASAGDTVWIRGGTYSFSSTSRTVGVGFSKAGGTNNPIRYFAYQSEIPVFDFTNMLPNARVTGFDVNTSWIHIRGIEIRYVQQIITGDSWGLRIRGSNNVIERMNVHHNEAPGIFITSGANNRILNCDSHDNSDPLENGGNADGFGCHSTGAGNIISGCRGYSNSDDGYDFINAPGACTVEKSWAFLNGLLGGNGAGFKAGGFGSPPTNVPNPVPRHVVRQCIAFGNRSQGFYANHHPGGLDFFNNVAFRNGTNYNMLTDTTSNHTVQNNIALLGGGTITQMVGGTQTYNSWSITGISATAADFLSMTESEATAPRQADGSLPNVNFMRLVSTSDLIDKGTNVGLPFAGAAPDLGPFETGIVGGAGGLGGMGGRAGNGGAAGAGNAGGRGGAGNGGAGNPGGMAGAGNVGGAGNAGGMAGAGNVGGVGNAGGVAGAGNAAGTSPGGTGTGNEGGGAGLGGAGNAGGAASGGAAGTATTAGTTGMTGGATGTGGAGTAASGGQAPGGATGTANAGSGAMSGTGPGDIDVDVTADSGCTCRAAGTERNGAFSWVALLSLLTVGALRRRKIRP